MTSSTLRPAGPEGEEAAGRGSDYAALCRQVRQAGMLKRRPAYYSVKIAANLGLFALGGVAFVLLGNSWYQLFVAAFLGVVFTQIAFVGHDAGHRQIAGSRRVNDALGLLHGNLLVGLSYGWWVTKHNRHHANPNHEGHDPDIASGVIAFSSRAGRPTSSFPCSCSKGSTCTSRACARFSPAGRTRPGPRRSRRCCWGSIWWATSPSC
jgi:fatty acid desaturase